MRERERERVSESERERVRETEKRDRERRRETKRETEKERERESVGAGVTLMDSSYFGTPLPDLQLLSLPYESLQRWCMIAIYSKSLAVFKCKIFGSSKSQPAAAANDIA